MPESGMCPTRSWNVITTADLAAENSDLQIKVKGVKRKFHTTFTEEKTGTTIRPPKRSEKRNAV
jgi:hypothetical protein